MGLMMPHIVVAADDESLESRLAVNEFVPTQRWFDGTVEALHQATISSQTAGRITQVNYDIDDYVEAGAELVQFSDVEQRAAFETAQAVGEETQARLLEATADYQRAEDLYQRKLGSKRDLDAALAARDASRARAAAAQSAIESTRQQLDYTLVKAPYPGIVTARHVEVGESVTEPLRYYHNNFCNAQNLLWAMEESGVDKFVFSSTAAIFGIPEVVPITEDAAKAPINPYGDSKLAVEKMLAFHLYSIWMRWIRILISLREEAS